MNLQSNDTHVWLFRHSFLSTALDNLTCEWYFVIIYVVEIEGDEFFLFNMVDGILQIDDVVRATCVLSDDKHLIIGSLEGLWLSG